MVTIETGLYVRIQQLHDGPKPYPLQSGFNAQTAYRVLGLHTPSETAEAYLILSNDRDELWFISNKHVRTASLNPTPADFRRPLEPLTSPVAQAAQTQTTVKEARRGRTAPQPVPQPAL
ncbi:hypothetical protein [Corticibacter populi]|uniref:hypothetical protein n=1 Tax=Corticibacter populi TaxID=1550736 RepID=UPI0010EC8E49|nr:hypothetical protein [Corticibacter populi]RZS35571.1 hypothetical protein EV687_0643 [Corticibacter populi]